MSNHSDDPVDDTTPIFTQADVFMIGGFLAELWDGPDDPVDDIEQAVQEILKLA